MARSPSTSRALLATLVVLAIGAAIGIGWRSRSSPSEQPPTAELTSGDAAERDYQRGREQEDGGDLAAALESYEKALASDPELAKAHLALGRIRRQRGELEAAVGHYRELTRLDPASASARQSLGGALREQAESLLRDEQPQQAVAVAEDAVQVAPEDAASHLLLGALYMMGGDAAGAMREIETSLRLSPSARAHNELGTVLLGLGRLEEAAAQFTAAIDMDADFLDAYGNLGGVRAMQGRLEEGAALYAQVLERDPDHVDARYNLAWIRERGGQTEVAIAHLEEVLKRRPDHAQARSRLTALVADRSGSGS